jgi:hypothetical protein
LPKADILFQVLSAATIAIHLYLEIVIEPHNKQVQADKAKAAPLIWAL